MTREQLEEVEKRPTYCRTWEPYVMITKEERDGLVALAKEALEAREKKELEAQLSMVYGSQVRGGR